jgi:hypothetical protein
VAISLEVVHQKHHPVDLRQVIDSTVNALAHARFNWRITGRDVCGVLQRPFSLAVAINLPEAVEGHRDRD